MISALIGHNILAAEPNLQCPCSHGNLLASRASASCLQNCSPGRDYNRHVMAIGLTSLDFCHGQIHSRKRPLAPDRRNCCSAGLSTGRHCPPPQTRGVGYVSTAAEVPLYLFDKDTAALHDKAASCPRSVFCHPDHRRLGHDCCRDVALCPAVPVRCGYGCAWYIGRSVHHRGESTVLAGSKVSPIEYFIWMIAWCIPIQDQWYLIRPGSNNQLGNSGVLITPSAPRIPILSRRPSAPCCIL